MSEQSTSIVSQQSLQQSNVDTTFLSHPLLPTVISTNIFNAFQISPEQFAQQLKQTTQEKEDDEEKKTLSQKQACIVQSADMYLQVKKKTQKQEQLKVFESMANSLMEPTTTDTTKEGDVLMLDHEQQHQSSDVGEFLIKLSALNIAQKQELDMMNQLCTEFVDQLQQTLKINQNNEQGDQSSQYNKKPEQLFSELKKKYSGQVLQVHTLDKKSTSVAQSKKKKKNFAKDATDQLNMWFFNHLHDPYPTDEEKKQLAAATNLSLSQVNNWFGNKRMRYKRKMLEQNRRAAQSGSQMGQQELSQFQGGVWGL